MANGRGGNVGELIRCPWANRSDLEREYHDKEWGIPLHEEHRLFEMLILEGHQAGLSWSTILRKRYHYHRAYDGFDAELMANYGSEKVISLLSDAGIVRNRRKIQSAVDNARAYLNMREVGLSLDQFLWGYVDGTPVENYWDDFSRIPATTPLSDKISKDLKKRGFSFVGSTIIYAYLQSTGVVDDHLSTCFIRTDKRSD